MTNAVVPIALSAMLTDMDHCKPDRFKHLEFSSKVTAVM